MMLRDSNTACIDQEGFGFDFDLSRCGSTTDQFFAADDIFRHGRLLPLALQRCRKESLQCSSFKKSNSETLRTWRNDSLDSQFSFLSTSTSTSSSSSQRKPHSAEILRHSNSKSKGNSKPSASGGKMSAKWRILSLGLMKPPTMEVEDLRLRQGKTQNNGVKNLDLRRSVSCTNYKDPKREQKEAKAVHFEENWRSVKGQAVVKKTPWLNGWKSLARLLSFQSRKTSSNAVVDNGRLWKASNKASCLC